MPGKDVKKRRKDSRELFIKRPEIQVQQKRSIYKDHMISTINFITFRNQVEEFANGKGSPCVPALK